MTFVRRSLTAGRGAWDDFVAEGEVGAAAAGAAPAEGDAFGGDESDEDCGGGAEDVEGTGDPDEFFVFTLTAGSGWAVEERHVYLRLRSNLSSASRIFASASTSRKLERAGQVS